MKESAMRIDDNNDCRQDDTSYWDERRGRIRSRKGGFVIGKGAVYSHGRPLLDDLMENISYFQLLVLHATGKLPDRPLADWLEASCFCTSYPDARIWCNHIGSLAGTLGASPVAGLCAGLLAADSFMYGPRALFLCARFIARALEKRNRGMGAAQIVETLGTGNDDGIPRVPGFNRPVASGDERIPALERLRERFGFERGPHLTLAFDVETVTVERYGEYMNSGGYRAAFLSDRGFTPGEINRIHPMYMNAGITACYVEAADRPPESFLPLRCSDVEYRGAPPRPVPEGDI